MAEPRQRNVPPPPPPPKKKGPPPIPADVFEEGVDIDVSDFETPAGQPTSPEAAKGDVLKNIEKLQLEERVAGTDEHFGRNRALRVSWEMRKKRKRAADERGEDAILANPERNGKGVADGLGETGRGEGARASEKLVEILPDALRNAQIDVESRIIQGAHQPLFEEYLRCQASLLPEKDWLAELEKKGKEFLSYPLEVQKAALAVFHGVRAMNPEIAKTGGKSTLTYGETVIVKYKEGKSRAYEVIVQVGDSDATLVSRNGEAMDVTMDVTKEQSTVDELIKEGFISKAFADDPRNWDKAFLVHGRQMTINKVRAGMFQALGDTSKELHPIISIIPLEPGDKVVYATDGIRDVHVDRTGASDPKKAAAYLSGRNGNAAGLERMAADAVEAKGSDGKPVKDDGIAAVVSEYNPEVAV